jgi:hypothetical protein
VYCKNNACTQSHFIEVAQGDIFMEQNMRFGPVGNTEKKRWGADYEQSFEGVFFMFSGTKKNLNFFLKIP